MRPDLLAALGPDLRPYVSTDPHTDADYQALADLQRGRKKPKVFSRWSQCDRKRRHGSDDEARKTARRMGKLGLTTYHCVHCGWWHVGRAR